MSVSVVIPCYNERAAVPQLAAGIRPVLDELERRHGSCELVLVDDGSSDGTVDALLQALGSDPRVRLLRHEHNRGLGAALRTGFAAARGEIIVTTDADGTYDFVEIPALLERMGPEVDIVTASPYHPEGGVEGVPAYRLALSRGASLIYRLLLDRRVHTYTSMFRAYRRGVLERVRFCSPGYLAMAEILAEALLAGSTVAEFPAVLRVRRYGQSKARVLRIMVDHLRFQMGLLGRSAARRVGLHRCGGSR
ncbi:MAG: glycosyltransferase family 2 protein [Myxococcales bacterium]|nr:glycosyltransferase family 2 protein [Myxococcota bacterium]MDW8282415.1 glycosyltransferase family 2 protein [Myxococcales bacterium]